MFNSCLPFRGKNLGDSLLKIHKFFLRKKIKKIPIHFMQLFSADATIFLKKI